MKLNENTAILTPRVLLVPYSAHHVTTYHEWMQDEDLQKLTASEPLTLPEEYAMQRSWRQDPDKLTFIVCTAPPQSLQDADAVSSPEQLEYVAQSIIPGREDAPENMIGDVNLFLYEDEDSDANSNDEENKEKELKDKANANALIGELEIMIARPSARGQGLARETLVAFLWYIISSLDAILAEYNNTSAPSSPSSSSSSSKASALRYLRVKIDQDNVRSIRLFERVGFTRTSEEANYFGEVELRMESEGWRRVVDGEGEMRTAPRQVGYGL